MWNCFVCKSKFERKAEFLDHVNFTHDVKEIGFSYTCGQEQCFKQFDSFSAWRRHITQCHSHLDAPNQLPGTSASSGQNEHLHNDSEDVVDDGISITSFSECDTRRETDNANRTIQSVATRYVSEMRSNASVTVSACEKSIAGCHDVLGAVVDKLKTITLKSVSGKLSPDEVKQLFSAFDREKTPLEFISTNQKQQTYFRSKNEFINPKEYVFGAPRFETTASKNSQFDTVQTVVYDSWQYISIEDTLVTVLSQPGMLQHLESVPRDDGIIESFKDGSVYQNHPLFSDRSKISVVIGLYYDDLEPANALGSKATIHKLGIFYITLLNLPNYFNSSSVSHHLVALGYTQDFKRYGYAIPLETIGSDLISLERSGFELHQDDVQLRCYASLGEVTGDCLALHTLFGLFESFRANIFCEQCMATQAEIQRLFKEDRFVLRTPDEFDQQLKDILAGEKKANTCGVKGGCALNMLPNWHVTTNKVSDLMHVHLEGVGPFEVKLVLHKLCQSNQMSLDLLNQRLNGFVYGRTDAKSKPTSIPSLNPAESHSLKQKAFQFFCLFRLLPLLIGDLVDPEDPFWLFYLELRRISDMLFAQKWSPGMAEQFSEAYALHQQHFKELFPEENLIPKHHILVHYGSNALATGPPYHNMVSSEEMKGSFLKRHATVMGNFRNVPLTLPLKSQFYMCDAMLAGKLQKNRFTFDDAELICVESLPCASDVKYQLGLSDERSEIFTATSFNFRGKEYFEGQMLCLRDDNCHEIQFGKLVYAVAEGLGSGDLYAVVLNCETLRFHEHFWSYMIKMGSQYECVKMNDLLDYHPLDLYSAGSGEFFVMPRYLLF